MAEEPHYQQQILHIFKKDARRYWYEIAVSLLLLGIYTWRQPREWNGTPIDASFVAVLLGWVNGLLPLSWIFLIVRAIHGETLVGDRQFWVTRPYEWEKLVAAKVLFVAAFVNVPLFVAQLILLKEAGFGVMRHLPGVLEMQGALGLLLLLPAALATVTRGLGQVIIVAIAALIALIGIGVLVSAAPNAEMSSANPVGEALQGILTFVAPGLAISWQYARRRTWQSRFLLLGAAGLIVLLQVAAPYGTLVKRKYPVASAERPAPVQLAFESRNVAAKKKTPLTDSFPEIMIRIPLRVSGVATHELVAVDGVRVVIDAPGGVHWDPGWKSGGPQFWPGEDSAATSFTVKKALYDKVKSVPVTLQVSLVMTQYRETNVREVIAQEREFAVAGLGHCRIQRSYRADATLNCHVPLKEPRAMARTIAFASGCPADQTEAPPNAGRTVQVFEWHGDGNSVVGISPINTFGLYFSDFSPRWSLPENEAKLRLCPGTAIRVATPEQVSHSRVELEVPGIRLEDYAWDGRG